MMIILVRKCAIVYYLISTRISLWGLPGTGNLHSVTANNAPTAIFGMAIRFCIGAALRLGALLAWRKIGNTTVGLPIVNRFVAAPMGLRVVSFAIATRLPSNRL